MSRTQTRTIPTPTVAPTTDESYDLDTMGVELEYPVAEPGDLPAPATQALRSGELRDSSTTNWVHGGQYQREHTGIEIPSCRLDIHSAEPESWYENSVAELEALGYPFAASGSGETNFGLHNHVSQLSQDQVETMEDEFENEWAKVFWCCSTSPDRVDPWRGGRSHLGFRTRAGPGHYEFRMPEPVSTEHFPLLVDFWRILARQDVEAAMGWAREVVYAKDERLTAVNQYEILDDYYDDWPERGVSRGRRARAEWFIDLMES